MTTPSEEGEPVSAPLLSVPAATPTDAIKLLFCGDVVGRPGRVALSALLPQLRAELDPDLIIVNGENSAHGFGLNSRTLNEILASGANLVTTGNHVFDQREFVDSISQSDCVLRPANYPAGTPGRGHLVTQVAGIAVGVVNLQARTFMPTLDCPFRALDQILDQLDQCQVVIVDLHGEATSEKQALGWYADGRISALIGTHTHVPTADHRVLPGGTAYVTDVGMVGPRDGVIGMDKEATIRRFLSAMPQRFEVAEGPVTFNSVLITISTRTGRATEIRRADREHVA